MVNYLKYGIVALGYVGTMVFATLYYIAKTNHAEYVAKIEQDKLSVSIAVTEQANRYLAQIRTLKEKNEEKINYRPANFNVSKLCPSAEELNIRSPKRPTDQKPAVPNSDVQRTEKPKTIDQRHITEVQTNPKLELLEAAISDANYALTQCYNLIIEIEKYNLTENLD